MSIFCQQNFCRELPLLAISLRLAYIPSFKFHSNVTKVPSKSKRNAFGSQSNFLFIFYPKTSTFKVLSKIPYTWSPLFISIAEVNPPVITISPGSILACNLSKQLISQTTPFSG